MTKKKTLRSKKHGYGNPEENVYGTNRSTNFMDEELKRSSLVATIKGCQGIIDYFRGLWAKKDMTQEVSMEIMKFSNRKYQAEQELEAMDNK